MNLKAVTAKKFNYQFYQGSSNYFLSCHGVDSAVCSALVFFQLFFQKQKSLCRKKRLDRLDGDWETSRNTGYAHEIRKRISGSAPTWFHFGHATSPAKSQSFQFDWFLSWTRRVFS